MSSFAIYFYGRFIYRSNLSEATHKDNDSPDSYRDEDTEPPPGTNLLLVAVKLTWPPFLLVLYLVLVRGQICNSYYI